MSGAQGRHLPVGWVMKGGSKGRMEDMEHLVRNVTFLGTDRGGTFGPSQGWASGYSAGIANAIIRAVVTVVF